MVLYWSDKPQDTPDAVKKNAMSIEIRPLLCDSTRDDRMYLHSLGNGGVSDNYVGWRESIRLVISEDVLGSTFSKQGNTLYVGEAVGAWEQAHFKWIHHTRVNGGEILQVKFAETMKRTHPGDIEFLNETEYALVGDVFHSVL